MRAVFAPGACFFVVLWLGLLVAGRQNLFRDPGTFWHTVAGELMLQSGEIIRTDPFSFTFAGKEWIAFQWSAEILMALGYRQGGFDLLVLVAVTIIAATYAWLYHRQVQGGLHWMVAALVALLLLAVSSGTFHVRPHLTTVAGFAITACLLIDIESERASIRRLWLLVPLGWVWGNLHGGWLGGWATAALTVGGWTACRLIGRKSPIVDRNSFLHACGALLMSAAVSVLNPYGVDLPRTWIDLMTMPGLKVAIKEHSPLDLDNESFWPTMVLGCYYAFLLLGIPIREWRVTWLLPLVWFYLSLGRCRHVSLFAVVAGAATAEMFAHTRWAARMTAAGSDLFTPPTERSTGGVRAFVLPVLCVVLGFAFWPKNWAQFDPKIWPVELTEEMKSLQPPNPGRGRIFNEANLGGWVIFTAPQWSNFIDDRCELYKEDFIMEYLRGEFGDTDGAMRAWETRFGPWDAALTITDSSFDKWFAARPQTWERIKRTERGTLYRRRSPSGSGQ